MRFKKDLILLGILGIVAIVSAGITVLFNGGTEKKEPKLQITASFYPMYIITLNLTEDVDGVEAGCMTQNQTGCLHDYQMTTRDMKTLENTDIFVINGGGMESFLEDVIKSNPSLTVLDAGEKLTEVLESHKEHPASGDGEQEEEGNAHFWLNPEYYCTQIRTVAEGLAAWDKDHAEKYRENADAYVEKVEKIAEELKKLKVSSGSVIVFHDAFAYLAEYLGLKVARIVELDGETSLGAGEVAEIMEEVRSENISCLFTEAQYSLEAADTIEKETGAVSYVIDSLVTGDGGKDSYLEGMERNLEVLKKAFGTLRFREGGY